VVLLLPEVDSLTREQVRVAGYSYADNLPVWAELARITGVTIKFKEADV
jgi:hypothetical protein